MVNPGPQPPAEHPAGAGSLDPGTARDTAADLLASLRLWTRLDEPRFRFLVAAAESGTELEWPQFRSLATSRGLADWDEETASLRPPATAAELATLGERERRIARRLLDRWFTDRDPELSGDALRWALLLQDWQSIDAAWLNGVRRRGGEGAPDVVSLLDALPGEARRLNPLLTWAWAAAGGYTAAPSRRESVAILRVVADAVSLHSRWREKTNTDAAVAAGSIWMLAQRFLPSSPPSAALESAWQTQQEVAEFIAERRHALDPPSAVVEVTFRAASARIALARADLRHVITEADFALALDPQLAEWMVRGATNFVLELAGLPSSPEQRSGNAPMFGIGLEFQDEMSGRLARALGALRRLDRAACEAVVAEFDSMPAGSPGWTGVVFLQQVLGALWGDPAETLNRTDAAIARHGMVWLEHRGTLGAILVGRGRLALLNRLGAYRAALEIAASLPEEFGRTGKALTLLWSGDYAAAVSAAEVALHDPETSLVDRVMMQVTRASALALDTSTPGQEWVTAAQAAVLACSENDHWLALALVPPEARDKLLGAVTADTVPGLDVMLGRIAGLSPDPRRIGATISLSRREQLLLPLLAGPQSVPEIAATLHVSANTVRKQVVTLRGKFKAATRQELVRRARDAGLL